MSEVVRIATASSDFDAFSSLVTEYVEWCRVRYQDHVWFVDQVFGHQSLSSELETLSTSYSAPNGTALLAIRDSQVCGGGAYRRLADGSCEMKRLYVPNRFKGRGTGRRLCDAIISSARDEGFQLMRLDTGNLFTEAIEMYKSFGFYRCPPHHEYPAELMPYLVFMEMPLTGISDRRHSKRFF